MAKRSRIQIKGMVCSRCIYVLCEELSKLGVELADVRLGEVILKSYNEEAVEYTIKPVLQKLGFDLLYNRHQKVIADIKRVVETGIRIQLDTGKPLRFSGFISNELNKEYGMLSQLFSFFYGCTLEKFIILRKMEKVKELLVYTDQTLSDIAFLFGYSSPAHLSNQLKKYTGFTSTYFKEIRSDKLAIIQRSIERNPDL